MPAQLHCIIANFTSPINIATTPQGLLWIMPLALSISIAYKAMKLPKLSLWNFIKETAGLFISIVVFMALIGLVLFAFDWLILQREILSF